MIEIARIHHSARKWLARSAGVFEVMNDSLERTGQDKEERAVKDGDTACAETVGEHCHPWPGELLLRPGKCCGLRGRPLSSASKHPDFCACLSELPKVHWPNPLEPRAQGDQAEAGPGGQPSGAKSRGREECSGTI